MSPLRIEHDRDKCITMGICESLAPEYFEVHDDGTTHVRRELVNAADLEVIRQAVASCPTGALRIIEDRRSPLSKGTRGMSDDFDPSGFDGVWRIYLPNSKVFDPSTGEWVPEVINDQVSEVRHDGDVMEFRSRIQHAPDLVLYLRYACRYGAEEWAPYTVMHIEGDPEHESLRPNQFRKVHARVGEPIGFVKQVYVDPRTRIRITRHPTGAAQYLLLNRLSEDRQRSVARVIAADSDAAIEKHSVRDSGPAPEWP